MTISKTKINKRMQKKTDSFLAEAIFLAKKAGNLELAGELAAPTRKQASVNIGRLNEGEKETLIVPGKVLSSGEIEKGKKLKVYAIKFSEKAEEKLKKAGLAYETIFKALKKGEKINGEIIR
jgi:large subunit ribosomal protein L18e